MRPTNHGLKGSDQPLVTAYDCAMLDLDGVVYRGPVAVDGVPELLSEARKRQMALAFVTNNAARTPQAVAAHLRELGIEAEAADVVTSAQAAAREVSNLVEPGASVLVIGGEGLVVAVQERGLQPVRSAHDNPAAVVQGFHPTVGWQQLAEGAYAIQAGAEWVAANPDLTVPTDRGVAPGNGALVNALSIAVSRRPAVVAGKPYRPLFDETVRRIGSERPLVVGDRLDTDIEGAVVTGTDSLLVMTGVTDVPMLCHAEPERRPTYVGWTLAAMMDSHPLPRRTPRGWEVRGWVATVEKGVLDLFERGENDDDGLRAAVAAAWAWSEGSSSNALDVSRLEDIWARR